MIVSYLVFHYTHLKMTEKEKLLFPQDAIPALELLWMVKSQQLCTVASELVQTVFWDLFGMLHT